MTQYSINWTKWDTNTVFEGVAILWPCASKRKLWQENTISFPFHFVFFTPLQKEKNDFLSWWFSYWARSPSAPLHPSFGGLKHTVSVPTGQTWVPGWGLPPGGKPPGVHRVGPGLPSGSALPRPGDQSVRGSKSAYLAADWGAVGRSEDWGGNGWRIRERMWPQTPAMFSELPESLPKAYVYSSEGIRVIENYLRKCNCIYKWTQFHFTYLKAYIYRYKLFTLYTSRTMEKST